MNLTKGATSFSRNFVSTLSFELIATTANQFLNMRLFPFIDK